MCYYKIHIIHSLAEELGCPEWKLADDEKLFLFPRFLLALNGMPDLAFNLNSRYFAVHKTYRKPVLGSMFYPNKIRLLENEIAPVVREIYKIAKFQNFSNY